MNKELEAFIRDKRNIHLSGDYSNPAEREDSFEAGVKIILDELEAALPAAPTTAAERHELWAKIDSGEMRVTKERTIVPATE